MTIEFGEKIFSNLDRIAKRRLAFGFIAGLFVGLAIAGVVSQIT